MRSSLESKRARLMDVGSGYPDGERDLVAISALRSSELQTSMFVQIKRSSVKSFVRRFEN